MTPDELEKLAEAWAVTLRSEGKARNTVRSRQAAVKGLAAWQRANGRSGFDRASAHGFIAGILDGGGAMDTARTRAIALRLFSTWLVAEGALEKDVLAGMEIAKAGEPLVPKLTEAELAALLAACAAGKSIIHARDEAIVRLMAETGARCDELLQMNLPGDLAIERRVAFLRETKGGKERAVSFSSTTAASIERYLQLRQQLSRVQDWSPLWLSERRTRLNYPGLYAGLVRRAEAAGIKGFHPHRLRHTGASRWLEAGGSEGSLAELFGWKSRKTLDRYVKDARAELALKEARAIYG